MEGQCSPHQDAQSQGLSHAQPEEACRNIPVRMVRQLGLPGDQLCGSSQSSPGGVPELEEKKGPGTLADLGQASRLLWTGLELEARRISAGKG